MAGGFLLSRFCASPEGGGSARGGVVPGLYPALGGWCAGKPWRLSLLRYRGKQSDQTPNAMLPESHVSSADLLR